jgi:glycosyltransferase involved in cell wall biosynthesis
VTAVAEPVGSFLRDRVGIPADKITVIPNGVDVERFETAKPVDRREWRCAQSDVLIACVGRLSPEKGQEVLLEAFGLLAQRHPAAQLIIVGDGLQRDRLRRLAEDFGIQEAVRWLGTRSDVPNVLAACDVVVLPSHHEGLPLVALEAMAAGKPVVATAIGALPTLIQEGRTGRLVPPGRADALAVALEPLIADADARARMGAEGRARVRRDHHFAETLSRYGQLYVQTVEARG